MDAPKPSDSEVVDAVEFLKDPQPQPDLRRGVPSLVTVCCDLTVALLRDATFVEGERIADIVLPAVLQLEPHLRERVLEVARGRLSDDQLRVILTYKPDHDDAALHDKDTECNASDDWDRDEDTTVTSLVIPMHPTPVRMLKTIDLSLLTSVNLAYCRIADLSQLLLPSGLRALGLRGVYSGLPRYTSSGTSGDSSNTVQKRRNEDDLLWASLGLTVLGKRLILLKVSPLWHCLIRATRADVSCSTCRTRPSLSKLESSRTKTASPPSERSDCAVLSPAETAYETEKPPASSTALCTDMSDHVEDSRGHSAKPKPGVHELLLLEIPGHGHVPWRRLAPVAVWISPCCQA